MKKAQHNTKDNRAIAAAHAILEGSNYYDTWLRGETDTIAAKDRVLCEMIDCRLKTIRSLTEEMERSQREIDRLNANMERAQEDLAAILEMAGDTAAQH